MLLDDNVNDSFRASMDIVLKKVRVAQKDIVATKRHLDNADKEITEIERKLEELGL